MRRIRPFAWPITLLLALLSVAVVATPKQASFAQYTPKAALEHGEALYTGTCASCHGQHGEGAGMPGLGIPRLDADGSAWQLSDIDLTLVIRNGKGAMPGVGSTWSEEDLDAVLTLLRSWWTPEQQRTRDAGPQTRSP